MNGRILSQVVSPHGNPEDVVMARDKAIALWFLRRYVAAQPAWFREANCRGTSVNFTSNKAADIKAALQLCGACRAMTACRAFADEHRDVHSVMGGEDPAARKARWHLEGRRANRG